MYKSFFKRALDLSIALPTIIILSPVFILITLGLYISNSGQPFFFQVRPGRNERLFKIIKFKTMNQNEDANGNLLPDYERITPLGAFVRKTSLDEIPQLLNVIMGDMSIVGPRPLLRQYVALYSDEQKKRHHVKPGITGWAQVNGRNAISWEQKFAYDIWYVEHCSFVLDVRILLRTVRKVFVREGINNDGIVTMQAFKGSK